MKMFFAPSNAMMDSGIAAWDAKRASDSVRPVIAISQLYRGKKIRAWGVPGKGTVEIAASQWIPYPLATFPTPPTRLESRGAAGAFSSSAPPSPAAPWV